MVISNGLLECGHNFLSGFVLFCLEVVVYTEESQDGCSNDEFGCSISFPGAAAAAVAVVVAAHPSSRVAAGCCGALIVLPDFVRIGVERG